MTDSLPDLYTRLATWWPLLSGPEDYAAEAAFYRDLLLEACAAPPRTVLELGSGGGNNASHLKAHFRLTLVDLSPAMLEVSRALNPECEHLEGDMRSVRLGREFDSVFVHDAVMYMTTRDDLRRAMVTAYVHCKAGGAALFAPDHVRETLQPRTDWGGRDEDGRGVRYLEWDWDPDPDDTTYLGDYAYLLREGADVRCIHDRHIFGVFPRAAWMDLLTEVGFRPRRVTSEGSGLEGEWEVFVGLKAGET
jgi:SAM-dependent methyltransferase